MKGCIFPLTIINAYLIRQFIMKYINKYKIVTEQWARTSIYQNYLKII